MNSAKAGHSANSDSSVSHTDDRPQNWSHVAETINMLYLAVCQIEATMTDSNTSVETLTRSFTELANHTGNVSNQIQDLTQVEELEKFKSDIVSTAAEMQSNISSSVEAFQFYDRVCQRVDHVARSLEKVTLILADPSKLHNQTAWKEVQQEIKSSYTMEAERIMFEYIMRGGSVNDALSIYKHHFSEESNTNDGDEIELF